jgi:hypothetical protein
MKTIEQNAIYPIMANIRGFQITCIISFVLFTVDNF